MKAIYRAVVEDLEARIARLQSMRDAILSSAEFALDPPIRKTWTKGRAKKHGADQVVLEVIRGGADTMKTITTGAKVKPHAAKAAVQRLMANGHVHAEGATVSRRYLMGKK
jgi:hypothetical protein